MRRILTIFTLTITLFLNSQAPSTVQMRNFDALLNGKPTKDYNNVLIKEVITVDLLELEDDEKIKLIGLKTSKFKPKSKELKKREKFSYQTKKENRYDPTKVTIEEKAFYYVKDLLEGEYVRLEFDADKKTDDFRTLVYLFTKEDNLFVNKELIKKGYADLQIKPPNTKYDTELRNAYKEARNELRGIQGK